MSQIDFHKLLNETYNHLWNGKNKLALTNARKLFNNYPNNSEAATVLAWALLESGYPIKALEYADLSLQVNGNDAKSKMIRAKILIRLNITDGASEDLTFSIENQKQFLGNSYIQYARLEAQKRNQLNAIKFLEKALQINPNSKDEILEFKKLLQLAFELESGKKIITKKDLQNYFDNVVIALKTRDVWFVDIVAEQILKNKDLNAFHTEAELIKLEGLLYSFQFKPALNKAEQLKKRLDKNEHLNKIHKKILKKQQAQEKIAKELDSEFSKQPTPPITTKKKRTDFITYNNKQVDVFSLKLFNQTEEEIVGKRTYYQQLDITNLSKIGVEIIFENLLFNLSENEYNARATWYVNDYEVFNNNFRLKVPMDWDTVIFIQAAKANWQIGQGRVDIYVENFKVAEKWFFIDSENLATEKTSDEKPPAKETPKEEEKTPELPLARPLKELLAELDEFVGLKNIKYAVKEFIDYLKFQQERESKGLHGGTKFSINAIFQGNPGTGKTIIARLMGEIFRAMGIVEKGHVVEVDRSSLVGQYVGETAQKTEKLIEEAMGGILFIDEAYTLVKKGGSGQDFGQEAIDILLKRMEDKKGEFVVIVAGYPKEMDTFISSNPGLQSRFNHTFSFEDYTPDELLEIFSNAIKKEDYKIEEDAKEELKKEFTKMYRKRDASFGNARLIMQVFERLKIQLSKRLASIKKKEKTKELLSTLMLDDVINILQTKGELDVQLPIDQEVLSAALSELNNLFGLQSIKEEVTNLVKLVKYFIKQGANVKDKFGDHILFLGNPGTGKTTVARIISNIYAALGILPSGQLIEVDRSGLVGSHVGETAQKTTLVIGSAMGGTLFVDEAYALTSSNSSSDFGKEAIDTLLKRMEDDRGKFIVIAAGYTNEMKNFIASNPGMKSRFTKTFYFEDYTPTELMQIAKFSIDKLSFELTAEAEQALQTHFNIIYSRRDKHFGNARIVRNLLEKIKKKQLLRIADESNTNDVNKITISDVREFVEAEKIVQKPITNEKEENGLEILQNKLESLIGHKSIKKQISKQIKSLQVNNLRMERGMKSVNKNLNSLFIGNSGSGTSTIANYLGLIYKELKFLDNGKVNSIKGSELIVADKTQARKKIERYINQSLGGILFIENLSTILQQEKLSKMIFEDLAYFANKHLGKLAIIVSGTRDELEIFSHPNSNIKVKFNEIFLFEDYTPRELLAITANLAKDNNYTLDEGALQVLLDIFIKAKKIGFEEYENIRLAEQILFKAISNQEERISVLYNLKDECLTTIIYNDIASIQLEKL